MKLAIIYRCFAHIMLCWLFVISTWFIPCGCRW